MNGPAHERLSETKAPDGTGVAGFQNATCADHHSERARNVQERRAAEHWFLDAAVYAGDGEIANARAAALRGIDALDAQAPS
jgi:hypothetical protein